MGVRQATSISAVARPRRYRRALAAATAAGAALLLVAGCSSSSKPAPRHGPAWTKVAHKPSRGQSVTERVVCVAASDCLSLGDMNGVEWRYRAGSWSMVRLPTKTDLTALSCVSPTFCLGLAGSTGAVTFDGSRFVPAPAVTSADTQTTDVACTSPTHCVAVDMHGNAFWFDGSSWKQETVTSADLDGVACVGDSFCAAVGGAVAYTWDGSAWSAGHPPGNVYFAHVSCASATHCVAVGADEGKNLSRGHGYLTIYDGHRWAGGFVKGMSEPVSVQCLTDSLCLASDVNGRIYQVRGTTVTELTNLADGYSGVLACAPGTANPRFCMDVLPTEGTTFTARIPAPGAAPSAAPQTDGQSLAPSEAGATLSQASDYTPVTLAADGSFAQSSYTFGRHDGPYTEIDVDNPTSTTFDLQIGAGDGTHKLLEDSTGTSDYTIRGQSCFLPPTPFPVQPGESGPLGDGSSYRGFCLPPGRYELQSYPHGADTSVASNWHFATLIIQ